MTGRIQPPEWSDLLDALAEDRLTDEQARSLTTLMREDVTFRREYIRFVALLTSLTWQAQAVALADLSVKAEAAQHRASSEMVSKDASSNKIRSFRHWRSIVAAMALCIVFVFTALWLKSGWFGEPVIAMIQQVDHHVIVTHHSGEQVAISAVLIGRKPFGLVAGDLITTKAASSARILAVDGTELRVGPESRITVSQNRGLQLRLKNGRVLARVVPQQPGEALILLTEQANVRVVGTELEVLALKQRTDIAVTSGLVRVTRIADGELVDVGRSQFVSVATAGRLAVRDVPLPPERWSEDFEKGIPPGWTGRFVRTDLPDGSRGAILAAPVQRSDGMSLEVSSPTVASGLFAWDADSVLHVTFRIQPPEWFHIYLVARKLGGDSESLLTYCCIKPELWQTKPGQWHTASIPLSQFHSVGFGQDEPTLGRIPLRLAFSSKNGVTGVALDRVWVDRIAE